MKVYVIASTKGGVGKTTTTVNIARKLAMKHSVGVLDGDLTSPSVCKILDAPIVKLKVGKDKISPYVYNNIKIFSTALLTADDDMPILFKGEKKRSTIEQFVNKIDWGDIDYLLIDAAPGCSDELIEILEVFKKKLDGVIIVTTPSRLSVNSVRKLVNLCKKKELKITGLVSNMNGVVCPGCKKIIEVFGNYYLVTDTAKHFNVEVIAEIPIVPDVENKPMRIIEYFRWVEEVL